MKKLLVLFMISIFAITLVGCGESKAKETGIEILTINEKFDVELIQKEGSKDTYIAETNDIKLNVTSKDGKIVTFFIF
jgi:uncharacterized lipoprotein YehR (DUF1307 family)